MDFKLEVASIVSVAALAAASLSAQSVQYTVGGSLPDARFGNHISATGDLNGDGITELAVGQVEGLTAGSVAGRVTVHCTRTGRVIHTFEGASPGDRMTWAVGVGDVDGDDVPDIGGGSQVGTGYVRVFSGATGAQIWRFDGVESGSDYGAFDAADVNGDGHADIIVGARNEDANGAVNSGRVYVYSGIDGSLLYTRDGDAAHDELGHRVRGIGDLDGDGVDDFTASGWQENSSGVGYVRVFSGIDGSVIDTIVGSQGASYFGTHLGDPGDLDGDGVPDISISAGWWNGPGGTNAGAVFVYSGADRSLIRSYYGSSTNQNFGIGTESGASVGDVNGDGVPDIFVGSYVAEPGGGQSAANGDGKAQIFSGAADASELFIAWGNDGDWFGVSGAGLGDIDGDGLAEFAVGAYYAGANNEGSVTIFASTGWATNPAPQDVALLDADGDTDIDAVTANTGSHDISVWPNQGDGTLGAATTVALGACDEEPVAIAAADLDDDGATDDVVVACAASDSVARVVDVGTTPVVTTMSAGGAEPVDVAAGDLDADGRDDVVVARRGGPIGAPGGVAVSLNGGAFANLAFPGAQRCMRVVLCDLDGDTDTDLAVLAHGAPDAIQLFEGDGAGTLTHVGAIALPTSGLASALCCEDVNADSFTDLVVLLPELLPTPVTNVRSYLYTPAGALDPSDYRATADYTTGGLLGVDLACAELDNATAGRDLVVVHAGSGDATAFNGYDPDTASVASTEVLTVGTTPFAAAVGEMTGDTFLDLAVVNRGSDDVSVVTFVPPAIAERIGTGCPGTGGLVPSLDGIGAPSLGNAAFGVRLTNARANAPAVLMFSSQQTTTALPPSACTLYVGGGVASLVRFTDGVGVSGYVFGVPDDPNLAGINLFFQNAVLDPNGTFAGLVAFSDALRAQAGR